MQNTTFSTLFVGQNFINLKEVDSTNNFLKKMASNSEPLLEGTVIMAENQYAGRGQQANVWHTEPGKNISLSIYLCPTFLPLNKHFYLNMAVSLAVSDTLSHFLPDDVKVKWPNDVYFKSKKIGGILIENLLTGMSIKHSIIGIGLNINQQSFNEAIREKATSVIQILQKEVDLAAIIDKLFVFIEKYYLLLKTQRYDVLKEMYLAKLYHFQKKAFYNQNGRIFEAILIGIEESGKLVLETDIGTEAFDFKEIEFIHTNNR
ncbi:biotin--[acetyl-CoA-carboxylase] ligase [Pedobacter sp. MW01-1-1]|uniref:biotin--[acetyl-CoA-carboxylase] ligase n=1 Tax=Pedobacter sp. MW01-1-1 TaxID=3383027 RepID=UPI003FEDE840